MPIIGMTDRKRIMQGIPAIGKLRKGSEKKPKLDRNGKSEKDKYGKPKMIQGDDLDYFRFTSERQEVVKAFQEIYGKKPAFFRVYLPLATPEENFDTWFEKWGSGRTLHLKCDGQHILRESKNGAYHDYSHLPPEERPVCQRNCEQEGCKMVGRLRLLLPELFQQGFIGPILMETHSKHDILTIFNSLEDIYEKRQTNGADLRNMEFSLRRGKKTISVPIEGKRAEVEKNLVWIEPSVDWARMQIAASQQEEQRMLRTAQENEIIFEDRHQEKETDLESSEMEVVETETSLDPKLVERFKSLTEEKIQQKILKPKKRQEARTLLETRQYTNGKETQLVTNELLKTFIQKLETLKPKPTKSDTQKDTGILAEITSLANQILDYMQVHEKALQDAPKYAETLKNLEGYVEAVKDGTDEFEPMSLVDRRKTLEGTLTTLKEIIGEKKQQ